MGYDVTCEESNIYIARTDKKKCVEALQKETGEDNKKIQDFFASGNYGRFELDFDEDDNVIDISFGDTDRRYYNGQPLLEAMAPWIKDNSSIDFLGEDGESFRWVFKNGKMKEQHAKKVYDD